MLAVKAWEGLTLASSFLRFKDRRVFFCLQHVSSQLGRVFLWRMLFSDGPELKCGYRLHKCCRFCANKAGQIKCICVYRARDCLRDMGWGRRGESRSLLPAVTSQTVSAPQPVQRKMFNPACYLNTWARAVLTFQAMLGEWQEGKWCLTTFKQHRRNEGGGGLMLKLWDFRFPSIVCKKKI